jgi:hypothetical protein
MRREDMPDTEEAVRAVQRSMDRRDRGGESSAE